MRFADMFLLSVLILRLRRLRKRVGRCSLSLSALEFCAPWDWCRPLVKSLVLGVFYVQRFEAWIPPSVELFWNSRVDLHVFNPQR